MMVMLSQLLRRQVYDQEHMLIGTLVDVLVPLPKGDILPGLAVTAARITPLVQAFLVRRPTGQWLLISPTHVEQVQRHALRLRCRRCVLLLAQPSPPGLSLLEAVFDHQIVDLASRRVQRVNEVWFDECWRLVGVASSPMSWMLRMLPARLEASLAPRVARAVLPWHQVALFPPFNPDHGDVLPLLPIAGPQVLASWSGASIETLVRTLRPYAGSQVLTAVSPSMAAKALGRMSPLQRPLVLKQVPVPHAAAIIKQLAPAVAAGVLETLPAARAEAILEFVEPEAMTLLQGARAYPADGVGSLMTSACLRMGQEYTTAQAIAAFRTLSGTPGQRAYLYCVTNASGACSEEQLVGVVSLWDVLAADPTGCLRDLMQTNLICVTPQTDLQTVAAALDTYDLLALPVVDEMRHLLGCVTLEALLPHLVPARRKRQRPSVRKPVRARPRR